MTSILCLARNTTQTMKTILATKTEFVATARQRDTESFIENQITDSYIILECACVSVFFLHSSFPHRECWAMFKQYAHSKIGKCQKCAAAGPETSRAKKLPVIPRPTPMSTARTHTFRLAHAANSVNPFLKSKTGCLPVKRLTTVMDESTRKCKWKNAPHTRKGAAFDEKSTQNRIA